MLAQISNQRALIAQYAQPCGRLSSAAAAPEWHAGQHLCQPRTGKWGFFFPSVHQNWPGVDVLRSVSATELRWKGQSLTSLHRASRGYVRCTGATVLLCLRCIFMMNFQPIGASRMLKPFMGNFISSEANVLWRCRVHIDQMLSGSAQDWNQYLKEYLLTVTGGHLTWKNGH